MSRSRHEHQVRLLDSYRGREFEQNTAPPPELHRDTAT
jgi:hypothetical protein